MILTLEDTIVATERSNELIDILEKSSANVVD